MASVEQVEMKNMGQTSQEMSDTSQEIGDIPQEMGDTPQEKEKPSHKCAQIPLFLKISLVCLCVFNYFDTVTDMVTTVGMFRDGKYVLGSLSTISFCFVLFASRILTHDIRLMVTCTSTQVYVF